MVYQRNRSHRVWSRRRFFTGSATASAARPVIYVAADRARRRRAPSGSTCRARAATISRAGGDRLAPAREGRERPARRPARRRAPASTSGSAGPDRGTRPIVYVTLPPPGKHPNTKRYLVAIDAPGFDGILTSDSTRIDGLVVDPRHHQTAVALAEGRTPEIRTVSGNARAISSDSIDRLTRVHRDRGWTVAVVALTLLAARARAAARAVLVRAPRRSTVALWLVVARRRRDSGRCWCG